MLFRDLLASATPDMAVVFLDIHDVLVSSLRWIFGVVVGVIAGSGLAALLSNRYAPRVVVVSDFLRAVPILGLVPIFQFYFGVNEVAKISLIGWAVMFPVAYGLANALRPLPIDSELFLRSCRLEPYMYRNKILVPRLQDALVRSIKIAIGLAWLVVVASEMIGTYSAGFWSGGLGYKLFVAYEYNRPDWMFVILGTFGVLGILSSLAWSQIVRRMAFEHE